MMKRILLPVSLYDIPGLEHWLENQANEGLLLHHINANGWAAFQEGGKPGSRFRLEPWEKRSAPSRAQRDLYEDSGWTYLCPVVGLYYLFYTTDPTAPELHTDPVTRGEGMKRVVKRVKTQKLFMLLFLTLLPLLMSLPFLLPPSRFDVQPDRWAYLPLYLVSLAKPIFLALLVLYLIQTFSYFRQFRLLTNLQRDLAAGLDPASSLGPQRSTRLFQLVNIAMILVLLINAVLTLLPDQWNLAWWHNPYVVLEELEGTDLGPTGRDGQRIHFSLLAPVWYEIAQKGYVPGSGENNTYSADPEEGDHYAPSLNMTRMELVIPSMAQPVARSLLDKMRLINLRWTYEEVDHPDLDLLILARSENHPWQMAALVKGRQVAVFRYAGQQELKDHLDLLTEMVDQ